MNIKKILIATLAVTVFDAVIGGLTCGWLFNWVYKLEPTNVWKSMEAPGVMFYIGAIVLNAIFVLIYAWIHKGLPISKKLIKGLAYGLGVWALGILPGMFATHMFMTVACGVVVYWTISALIQVPLKGLITAAIIGE